jgi:hypothetical protein
MKACPDGDSFPMSGYPTPYDIQRLRGNVCCLCDYGKTSSCSEWNQYLSNIQELVQWLEEVDGNESHTQCHDPLKTYVLFQSFRS